LRTVTVTWRPDEETFVAAGSHPGRTISVNAPHEPDSGHPATGFSATELLLAGVGACAAWDVVEILRKARQPADAVEVEVTGEQEPEPPWTYRHVRVHFTVRGAGLRRSLVERAVRLSCDRYCSVIDTIRGRAQVVSSVTIVPGADVAALA
jgi:putative redox protein